MTFAGLQNFRVCNRTESLTLSGGSGFADLSKFAFCAAFDFFHAFLHGRLIYGLGL